MKTKNGLCLLFMSVLLPVFTTSAEVSIPNFSAVDAEEVIFRGSQPGRKVSELSELNITDVIIFKNDTKGEVPKELADLEELGINGHHIPFHWKDIPSLQMACEQVIEALSIIKKVKLNGGSVFFHCTVGEDRTGLLAGLYRMLEESLDQETAFNEEMCLRGYSDGNPNKPGNVTGAIEKGLTPLFLEMSRLIESGELSMRKLDKKVCKKLQPVKTIKRCQ